jgi:hypothetical protein
MSLFDRFRSNHRDGGEGGRPGERVLVLTPVKDAEAALFVYWSLLYRLTYPRALISLGFLEGDSTDRTLELLTRKLPVLQKDFRRANVWKRDFGYRIPSGVERHEESIQLERRSVLARSRNHLLMHALDDEDWVLWMDADLLDYPPDIIQTLLATGKDIVQPQCVIQLGGPTFDRNAWSDHGRLLMESLRDQDLVRLDAVGGTMLLVRADLHRDGLIFPPFPYGLENPLHRPGRGEIETEGLGIMARDMGIECWGLPRLEIRHRSF